MKLKQKLALGLCAFYLISVIGVALSLHFCGGNLSAVSFTHNVQIKECKPAEKIADCNPCCKNTAIHAKIKDSHESGVKVSIPKDYSFRLFLQPFSSEIAESGALHLLKNVENKAPPFITGIALHIFHCIFRI